MNENNIKKLLGKKNKELRIKKGFTQEQLSEKIGIGERNLSKIECGNNFVTAETLSNLLIALEVSAKDLFDFDYYKKETDIKNEIINAIENDEIDVKTMYKFYVAIK